MLHFPSQSSHAECLGWLLIHSLWQFALVMLLAMLLQRVLQRHSSETRYWALAAAMLMMVVMPVATWLLPRVAHDRGSVISCPVEMSERVPSPTGVLRSPHQKGTPVTADKPAESSEGTLLKARPRFKPVTLGPTDCGWASSLVKNRLESLLPGIVLIWFAGVSIAALRPLVSWYTVHRLRSVGVLPVADAVHAALQRAARRLRFVGTVAVLRSALVKTPVVIGCVRPIVLLPLSVVVGLPETQLELILMHELAHIRRHDYLINLLQVLMETLFFYHPAVWWLSRQIRIERENCCDDAVLATSVRRADYGRTLLALEECRARAAAFSLAARRGPLVDRIRRIAGDEPPPRFAGGSGILCAILIVMAISATVAGGAAPTGEKSAQTTAATGSAAIAATVPAGTAMHIDRTTRNHSISTETVAIAADGLAKLPIVISERAGKETTARAHELALYLERITGARFEVKTGSQGPGILVGTLEQFPTPSSADGLRIYDVYDGRDAYAIRTEGGCVKLLGATDLGVSHAVSRFLESFGCRWFFPGPVWEVVPRTSKLTFKVNETDRPEVLGANFGYDLGQQYEKEDPDAGEATKSWYRKNRVPRGFKSAAGHRAHNVVSRFWKEFEAHPEYRALIKDEEGKLLRTGTGPETPKGQPLKPGSKSWGMWGQLCASNPETVKLVTRYAQEWLDKNPGAEMVGVGPDDGGEWCLCPECAKLGNRGNQAFHLANQVAKAIQKSHPGKLVGLLAYNWHCDPPDFPLEPNVYVELTTSMLLNTKYGFDRLQELWPRKVKYFGLYDYWAVYDWTRDSLPSGRTGSTRYVADNVASFVRRGVACMRAECGNSWGPQGIAHYLVPHVLWNSSADIEAVKADFYDKAFGPAAQAVKAYYDHVDMGNEPLVGPPFYRTCLDHLEAAERAAAGRPDVLARITQLKQYNIYAYLLNKERDAALKPDVRKNWAFETLRWNYRIRNTYMTFWTFFAGFTTKQWAKEFNEPTWNWYEMRARRDLIPYRDPSPITAEEVDRRFQEMKADYGVAPAVTSVSFSKRLAAPDWPAKKPSPGEPTEIVMHGAYTMALASLKGEPLRFSIRDGIMYPDNPPAAYVLTDMAGKEIARGEVPICRKIAEQVELKVPAAGVYYFKFNDYGAGTTFTPAKDQRAAFVPEGPRGYTLLRSTWFYVPKGTAEIQFCAAFPGGKLGVCDPSGRWIESNGRPHVGPQRELLAFKTGSYCIIPVPKGMDGAMWKLVLYQCGLHLRFFNIPTILSLTSDGPIMPEEVAKKDGFQ